ncbi:MAG TPA: hypothetical protein VK986_13355 [Tepidisphaeraceae bacterium]|nr:hypothetical protein [Tepidisphaeraceae bacterium]
MRMIMRVTGVVVLLSVALAGRAAEVVEQASPPALPWDAKALKVMAAARDPFTGALWVGMEGWGVYRHDGKRWQHWSTKSGMVDDAVYALAVDHQGRVWAGHCYGGVSVFDGAKWRAYDPVAGLGGTRVFAIKACPAGPHAGDVWIATDGGLTRYRPKADEWVTYTRADGLPADQVQAIAFDAEGRLIAGMQCEGLAIASPENDYATWTNVTGPDRPGVEPVGKGLPSCMVNDVLVARDGTVYVATPWGLGKSIDGAKTFTFRRGQDFAGKVKDRTGGAPAGFKPPGADVSLLAEDYVTCLAEDEAGLLWVGYRTEGYEAVDEANEAGKHAAAGSPGPGKFGEMVTCILPRPAAGPLVGTYGAGLLESAKYFVAPEAPRRAALPAPAKVGAHPSAAKAPSPKVMDALRAKVTAAALPPAGKAQPVAAFLGDDWSTRGDFVGRYGRQIYLLPNYGQTGWAQGYGCQVAIGPHESKNKGGPYTYWHKNSPDDPRVLYVPNAVKRYQGEWNDGSFDRDAYHEDWEGPDLWLDVTVPAGTHRLSLYFINFDGTSTHNRRRDFLVELKENVGPIADAANFAAPLARTRVVGFYNGVYKQFVVAGPAKYYVKINRNYSMCTKLSGVFFDRVAGAAPPNEPGGVPIMGEHQVKPPALPPDLAAAPNVALRTAAELTAALDGAWASPAAISLQRPGRMAAIRLAASEGGAPNVVTNWRFALPLMLAEDRPDFARTVAAAADHFLIMNPHVAETALKAQFADAWKKLGKQITDGAGPDPAKLVEPEAKPDPTDAPAVRAALVPYLLARAGKQIEPRGLSTREENPAGFLGDIKGVGADKKALYQRVGEILQWSQANSERTSETARRQGLAAALGAARAALDPLDDTWLAARIAEGFVAPQLGAASDAGPLVRSEVLSTIVAAHADDPDALSKCLGKVLAGAPTAGAADALRLDVARALAAAHKKAEAAQVLRDIPEGRRTPAAAKLLKEVE